MSDSCLRSEEVDFQDDFDLNLLRKKYRSVRFYGETRILWQDGEIVMVREERSFKPSDWYKIVE